MQGLETHGQPAQSETPAQWQALGSHILTSTRHARHCGYLQATTALLCNDQVLFRSGVHLSLTKLGQILIGLQRPRSP